MATYYNTCECGARKAVLNGTCRACYIKSMKTKNGKQSEDLSPSTVRTCQACFGPFKSSSKARYCTKCNNWGKKYGYATALLKHNLEICDDPDRKQKIVSAIEEHLSRNPSAAQIANEIEIKVANLRKSMKEIVYSEPFARKHDKDGFPIYKKQSCGWRCPSCGRAQTKRACRLCEMKIRGQI